MKAGPERQAGHGFESEVVSMQDTSKSIIKVFSENLEKEKTFDNLVAAKAYRLQKYGYAGYIIEFDDEGNEINNYS